MQKASPISTGSESGLSSRPPVLDLLQSKSDADLLIIFKNCVRALAKGPNENAVQVIRGIEEEWQGRLKGWSSDPRPNEGMLASLGYHVGNNGETLAVRRRILKHVLEGELPVVGSVAYTAEWGRPLTQQRFDKLTRFFMNMLDGARNNPGMTSAIAHWQADLDWVIETCRESHHGAAYPTY
jgi:hypothetical protein